MSGHSDSSLSARPIGAQEEEAMRKEVEEMYANV